ncbi:MAG: hypothetical protein QG657_1455, partial [Acidobacteriota bacterium]|nr:hypothetical protein [Acidobacteriota bacterium]
PAHKKHSTIAAKNAKDREEKTYVTSPQITLIYKDY